MKTQRKTAIKKKLNNSKFIAIGFALIILIGSGLLMLPFASRNGESCNYLTAIFTATSATCVTGLNLVDPWTQWSFFGQCVILVLIEIGGLGFMSLFGFIISSFRRKANMRESSLMADSVGAEDISKATTHVRRTVLLCLLVQGIGAVILTIRWIPQFGILYAIKLGIFHSVSAFCNAGFDILGFEGSPGLTGYSTDIVVLLTLGLLIVVGGMGFLVWMEVFDKIRKPKSWSVYTKLVFITTGAIFVVGMGLILLVEWNNPNTIGNMNVGQKILASFFQVSTSRTAGFAALDQGALTEAGKGITTGIMFIGGSSGSTAGGIKTVTFVVIVLFLYSRARGNEYHSLFYRTIPRKKVLDALVIVGIMAFLSIIGAIFISATSPGTTLGNTLYEAVSAISTTGLSTGITPTLSLASHILLILYMYFGRVGILTFCIGFFTKKRKGSKYKYANAELLIG